MSNRWSPHVFRIAMCGLTLFLASSSVAQETPVVELSGGYQYMSDISAEETFPQGWFASAGWNVTDWLAIVGEFTNSARTIEGSDIKVYTTMGGVRFRNGGFFGQVLVGQLAIQLEEFILIGTLDQTLTETAIQPGVGFDIGISNSVSARIKADYLHIFSDEDDFGRQLRIAAGVVVGIGGR